MNTKRIATYSLLAQINDNSTSLNDINYIFIPLVKSVIGEQEQKGVINSDLATFKSKFDEKYGLKTPIPLLKKLLLMVTKNVEKDGECTFTVNKDGSYMLGSCSFLDYMDILTEQTKDVELLEQAFNEFKESDKTVETSETIYSFIDNNRKGIIKIITGRNEPLTDDTEFKGVLKFINKIKNDVKMFNIIKKIYLGSIMCCYLEYDLVYTGQQKMEFLLDTNFIIKLLDLNTSEDTEICKQILTICGKIGHKLCIMDYTLKETTNLLEAKAEFVSNISIKDIGMDSIYFACTRRRITKTQLQTMANKLEETLTKLFAKYSCNLNIIRITDHIFNLVKNDDVYKKLIERENNKDGVLHDATAVYYIKTERHKRNIQGKKNFKELLYWFVTDDKSLLQLPNSKGYNVESIEPNKLLNILWLGAPSVDSNKLKDVGLTKLISNTINNCLSKSKVFKELEENFTKYENVTEDDVMWLSYAVSINSVNLMDIEEINTYKNNNFADKIHEKIRYVKHMESEVIRKQSELEQTKADHSSQLKKSQEMYEEELKNQRQENKKIQLKYEMAKILKNNELEAERQKSILAEINRTIGSIQKKAKKQVLLSSVVICLIISAILYFSSKLLYNYWTSKNLEPIVSAAGIALPIFLLFLEYFLEQKFDIINLRKELIEWRTKALLNKKKISNDKKAEIEQNIYCLGLDIALCNTIFEDIENNSNLIELSVSYSFNLENNSDRFKEIASKIDLSA